MKSRPLSSVESSLPALPAPELITLGTILVPTDFSPLSDRAVTYAHCLASQFGARLILLHVAEPVTYAPAHCPLANVAEWTATHRAAADAKLAELIGAYRKLPAGKAVTYRTLVVEGDAAKETDRIARESEADLIVIATHGYSGLSHFWLGGTTEKVIRHAPCPVLVVREKERDFVPFRPVHTVAFAGVD